MAVELVAGYGWVIIALLANLCLVVWMGIKVGQARRMYKVFYPTMYAVEGEHKDAKVFNCIQRGHQNTLEFMPIFISMLLLGGLQYPVVAAILGAIHCIARFQYFRGYSTGNASARYANYGGAHFIGINGLFICTIALALHQFFPALV